MLKRILFTSAVVAAAIGLSAAQTPPAQPPGQPPAQPGQATQTATKTYRAKELLGTKINIEGNANVGTVDDIVLSDEGVIQYLIVTTADNKLFTVPWDAAKFNWTQRTA